MRHTRIFILSALLVLATCSPSKPASSSDGEDTKEKETPEEAVVRLEDLEDASGDLPILPPIILIDFTNGTNSTSDEKSKRTINGNLGYGFQRNDLFTSGKYNYYFPAGKTGTTVSIEESISPFLPKTITEIVKPIVEQPHNSGTGNVYTGTIHRNVYTGSTGQQVQGAGNNNGQRYDPQQLIFGQRTKLQKSIPQRFPSTPRPNYDEGYSTPKSTIRSNTYSPGSNSESYSYTTQIPNYEGFSTPRPATAQNYNLNSNENSLTSGYNQENYKGLLNSRPTAGYNPAAYTSGSTVLSPLRNTPKYSYENGIKYEHKIVWKYPDGKVSEFGPTSYINSYSEYSAPSKTNPTSGYQNNNQESVDPANVYSKSPATFPRGPSVVNQLNGGQNQYVTSSSLPNVDYSMNQNRQNYQDQYGTKSEGAPGYQGTNQIFSPIAYGQRTVASPYPVDSPEAEYTNSAQTYPTNPASVSTTGSSLYTSTGQVSPNILSKYRPQVQQYLTKALGLGAKTEGQNYDNSNSESYANVRYSNLLNYNPSISQYIRNPASILNAQPTFIQAGNSLIPVIVLRVDGVAPIQPKITPNVNLKALLQQYLTHYAQSINDLSRNQNLGETYYGSQQVDRGSANGQFANKGRQDSSNFDLNQLTQSLGQLGRDPSFGRNFAQSFAQNVAHRSQVYDTNPYSTRLEYNGLKKSDNENSSNDYERSASQETKRTKVKNVQIIEDPRFTSYKVDKS